MVFLYCSQFVAISIFHFFSSVMEIIITITNVTGWSIEIWTNGDFFDTYKESLEMQGKIEYRLFLILPECDKMISVGIKLNGPCCNIGYCF